MKKTILFLFLLIMQMCFSQDGDMDLSFHSADRGNGYGGGIGIGPSAADCYTLGIQPDGKILVGTNVNLYNGVFEKSFFRINPNGEVDTAFGQGLTGPMFGVVYAASLFPDGKIIVGGTFTNYNGTALNRIARLNPDGALDTTFNPGTGANGSIFSIALLPNGKTVIVGNFTTYNGIQRNRIAVLNNDGSLDMSFNPNSGANALIRYVFALNDGSVLISGDFTYYNVTPLASNSLVRILSDGTIDLTFPSPVRSTKFRVLNDGKILGIDVNTVKRVNATGTIDNTFNYGIAEPATDIYPLPDGKVIVSVLYANSASTDDDDELKLVRLNADGSLDNSFHMISGITQGNEIGEGGYFMRFVVQPDGRLLAAGYFVRCSGKVVHHILRINTDGSYDASFNGGIAGADNDILVMSALPDGKIAISGSFIEYDDVPGHQMILNADGSLNAVIPVTYIGFMAPQSDGKILMAGNFAIIGNSARYYLKRANADGTIDTSFNLTLLGTNAFAVAVQPDDKILIAGNLGSSYNFKVYRLNSDGSVDETFNQSLSANSTIRGIVVQPDGKILLTGEFTSYGGTPAAKMVRLLPNGAVDTSFNVGTGFTSNPVSTTLQPDGKIVVIGNYPNFNGAERKIVRLNPDGTIDLSFDVNSGPASSAKTLALQIDGKVLVGGNFTTFNGQAKNYIVRLNNDGSVDNSFNSGGTGANNSIQKIIIQPNGKPLIAGAFTNYNGYGRNRIARLNPVVLGTNEITDTGKKASIYPNPVKDILHIEAPSSIQTIEVFDLLGKNIMIKKVDANQSDIDLSGLNRALYFVKVATVDGSQNFKVVKE